MSNMEIQALQGSLGIEPALSWDQIKNTEYLDAKWHRLQGRNSSRHLDLEFQVEDCLVESPDGDQTFTKHVYTVVASKGWHMTVRTLVFQIEGMLKQFPEHEFEGTIHITCTGGVERQVVVQGGVIMVLEPVQFWLPVGEEPPRKIRSRWDIATHKWVDENVWTRLGRANELLRILCERRKPEDVMKSHLNDDHDCDEDCLVYQIADHLLGEKAED